MTELNEVSKSDFMVGFFRGRAEGIITTEEYIIKLLEEAGMSDAVAVIKGETNE
jgi:hypothetical protein